MKIERRDIPGEGPPQFFGRRLDEVDPIKGAIIIGE